MGSHPDDTTVAGSGKPAENRAREAAARRNLDDLPPAAQRALKEAEERRKAQNDRSRCCLWKMGLHGTSLSVMCLA